MLDFTVRVRDRMQEFGETREFTFLHESASGGTELAQTRLSFAALDRQARGIAGWLQDNGYQGGRVVLLYPSGPEFLVAFVGCLYAGVIAVPAPMPSTVLAAARLDAIITDVRPQLMLTTTGGAQLVAGTTGAAGDVPCVTTDAAPLGDPGRWRMPAVAAGDVAVIQYTSGSTSEPKGVLVTHVNLVHNEEQLALAMESHSGSVGVSWIPHYHDMGLFGTLLHSLYIGANCFILGPTVVLKRPVRWLETITRHRATMTVAPDFAYELCTRNVTDAQLAGLDLSSLTAAMNGSEPIRATTVERFLERFRAVGMRPATMFPCFGMAEVTLLATGSPLRSEPVVDVIDPAALERGFVRPATDGVRLVGSGRACGTQLLIVDPVILTALPADRVGEIWISGDSVAAGYWNRPAASAANFGARTVDGDGPFLRTGDLGYLRDGELFVTGRLKDVIVVNGRNLHAHDIEMFVQNLHPALAAAAGAAFGVRTNREHVVVVHEIKKGLLRDLDPTELAALIRQQVSRHFDLPTITVVIVGRGVVPRTTSNKIQRSRARQIFLEGGFRALHEIVEPALQARRDAGRQDAVPRTGEPTVEPVGRARWRS